PLRYALLPYTTLFRSSATVKHGLDTMDSTSVGGYGEEYLDIMGYEIGAGRNLLYSDMASRQKVAFIGDYVAEELYGSAENAVGRSEEHTSELQSRFDL